MQTEVAEGYYKYMRLAFNTVILCIVILLY